MWLCHVEFNIGWVKLKKLQFEFLTGFEYVFVDFEIATCLNHQGNVDGFFKPGLGCLEKFQS